VDRQLAGVEALPGTYPFTLERSATSFRLNAFLHGLVKPEHRRRFLDDPDACMAAAGQLLLS
jgi:gallate dioxygenase